MGDANSQYFDLTTLLRLGDADVRRVVRNNLSMRVGEYTALLSRFEYNAPNGLDALNRLAALEANDNDLQILANIRDLLEDIGCIKIIPAIDDIIKAGKRGHADFAADCSKKILEEYKKLQGRITAAKKAGKPEGDSASPEDRAAQLLKDALLHIDEEEATRKLRILAVDDAPVMIKTISSVLNEEYKVYGMTNPTMLEKFLGQITPDLFLLDYQMPEINGFELVPIIRSFEDHKDTPIIFLTSLGTIEHISAAAALGACDFIVKPFQGDILREKVAKHIVKKKLLL